jgi:hypothetical protein
MWQEKIGYQSGDSGLNVNEENIEHQNGDSGLNINAREFHMPVVDVVTGSLGKVPVKYNSSSQTDLPMELHTSSTQTDSIGDMKSVGVQCIPERKNIGIKCSLQKTMKNRYIQATVPMASHGVSTTAQYANSATQSESVGGRPPMCDVGVMCSQSPGAINRHAQTISRELKDAKINTVLPKTVNMATETDTKESWKETDGLFDPKASESESATAVQSQQISSCQGKFGLPDMLDSLGVTIAEMEQYAKLVHDCNRNVKPKFIIQAKYSRLEGEKMMEYYQNYYAVMDYFVVSISKIENEYALGQYTKLYGDCRHLLCACSENSVYTILDTNNDMYKICEEAVLSELDRILSRIRSLHNMC